MTVKHIHKLRPLVILWLAYVSTGCQAVVEAPPSQPEETPQLPTSSATATAMDAATVIATEASTASATATPMPEAQEAGAVPAEQQTLEEAGIGLAPTSLLFEQVTVETVPAQIPPAAYGSRFLAQPAHTILHLEGYTESGNYRQAQLVIFPVDDYVRLTLEAEREVEQLQALLAADAPLEPLASADGLPYLPAPHAVQILHARAERLAFQNGDGIRYLTQYVQDIAPIISSSLFYTYQGLTADGQFWVSATLPVASDALPKDIPAAQEQGFDSFTLNFDPIGYEAYLTEQQAFVDGLPGDAFSPDLETLDALVQSLDLAAYDGPGDRPWAPEVAPDPDQALDAFLEGYLTGGGFPAGLHRNNDHLHPDFVAQIEETIAAYRQMGIQAANYDPILMSVLGPAEIGETGYGFERIEIGPASIEEGRAHVVVERHWHYTHAVSPLHFTFTWNGERWQISDVSSHVTTRIAEAESAPVAVTEQFMSMMTASTSQFDFIDEWLREVRPDFVLPNARLDLCSQSWPIGFTIEGSFIQPDPLTSSTMAEEEAYVVVHLPFSGSLLTTHLFREGDVWQVSDVVCGDTPQGRALAFYAWYLGAAANAGETRWAERAPNIDRMNPGHTFVSERFLREAQQRFQENPYLPSARVPDRFVVKPGAQENVVLVDLEYLGESQATIDTLQLTFVQEDGSWLVDGVEMAGQW